LPTIRFDRIAQEFIRRIGQRFVSGFIPGTAMPATNGLTTDDISAYVNKALLKFVEIKWDAAKGNVEQFAGIFPELISGPRGPRDLVNGAYTIATPDLDFFKIMAAWDNTKYIKIWPEAAYSIAITGAHRSYIASNNEPAIIQLGNILQVFPTNYNSTISIIFIKQPLIPETGEFLIQNGTTDSPFYNYRNSSIAEIAEGLFRNDNQIK
jgi:hypothetical protein